MIRIFSALMLLILSCFCMFVYYFIIQHSSLDQSLILVSKYFTTLAGTTLFISTVLKSDHKTNIICIVIYVTGIIAVDFYSKNFLIHKSEHSIKKGVIVRHPMQYVSFGTVIKTEAGIYQVSNIMVSYSNQNTYAEFGQINTNQLILSNVYSDTENLTTIELPMSINMDVLFPLWNESNPNNINTLQGIMHYNQLGYFHKGILLALGQYVISFIVLLLVGALSLATQSTLAFNPISGIGIIITYFSVYCLIQVLFFYNTAILEAIIFKILS